MLRFKNIFILGTFIFASANINAQSVQLNSNTKSEVNEKEDRMLKQLEMLPPPAVMISDIPAYNNYFSTDPMAQIVSYTTEEVKVEKAEVPVEKVVIEESVKGSEIFVAPDLKVLEENALKNTKIGLASAKRISAGELFPALSDVYFIQLASLSSTNGNVTTFKKLTTFGNIYKIKHGATTKIKLGYFVDKYEADRVLSEVKVKGYNDAFITKDRLNTEELELVLSTYDNDNSTTSSYTESSYNAGSYTTTTTKAITYKVRLASYEDPIWFDIEKAKKLGTIEQWTKGSWTIFVLSEFPTYEAALNAKSTAINKGFKDAEVVADNNGILETIK